MKKTPKILPHLYKSKGTPIFRDTTALPFAKGGPLPEEPVNPVNPPSWNRPQLSPERIAALRELHQNSFFDSVNPNDLLFYDLNKDAINNAENFGQFLDPSLKVNPRFTDKAMTQDIKTRLIDQGWALDTKTGGILRVPDELRNLIITPEPEPLEKLEPLRPELISRNIPTQLSIPPQPEVLPYQMPGYMKSYNFPTVGRYTPLAAKAVQKVTGYDRNFMEGYYDEEGNYVPGELENAREQNRAPQFQGASSLRDMFAQKAYQQALEETKSFAQGGELIGPGKGKKDKSKKVEPFVTSDPKEYAYRKAAYDDSLSLFNLTNAQQKIASVNKDFELMTPQQKKDYYYRNHYNHWQAGTTGINPRFFGQDEGSSKIVKVKGNITKNNLKSADTDYYHPTIKPHRHYTNPFSITENFLYKKPVQQVVFQEEIKKDPTIKPIIPIPPGPPPTPPIPEPPSGYPGIMPQYDIDEVPMYATPDGGAEWIGDTQRYIDWDGNSVGYRLPRFKQPGHGGPLIKAGKKHYFHYPSIETRNQIQIIPEEDSNSFANGGTIHFERSEYGSDAREHYDEGGPIYTYSKRPGSYYQRADDGSWMINNSSTDGQYVPINDPTGQRTALLNKNAVVYNAPAQGPIKPAALRPTTALPQVNQKIYPGNPANFSETTQAVAAKTVPQSAEERANVEGARKDIAQRKSNLEKVLMTQGKTPEQAASIVGSYGSDWTTLEADNARALDTMARRAEAIQSGGTPDKMSEYVPRPEQSTLGFARDVLFNPFTAAGYAIRGQEIPDYMGEKIDNGTLGYYSNGQFVEGRNALDTVTDVATPIGWAHSAYNIADKATNNKSGDFWTEENAWDALNVLPGIGLAAKGMKYVPLANRIKFGTKSAASNLAVDAGNIAREPFYAPQRPSLLSPAVAPINAPKKLPGFPNGTFAYKNVTPSRVRATNTGLTNADVDTEVAKNIKWITSPEYAARRAANTGESLEEIQKSVSSIISDADKAKFNLNSNPKIMDLYEREGVMKSKEWWRPAKVEISANAGQPAQTLKHEVKHLYSPAIYNQNKLYDNYPTLGDKADDYLGIGAEQQVRHLNAREQILAENNLPIDAKLSEEQVREFVDGWGSRMNKMNKTDDFSSKEDFDAIWNDEAAKIQKEMLMARYNTDDLNFVSKLPTSQKVKFISEYRDRLTRSITKVLNKAWVAAPAAGGTALLNNSENQEENK